MRYRSASSASGQSTALAIPKMEHDLSYSLELCFQSSLSHDTSTRACTSLHRTSPHLTVLYHDCQTGLSTDTTNSPSRPMRNALYHASYRPTPTTLIAFAVVRSPGCSSASALLRRAEQQRQAMRQTQLAQHGEARQ